jgi:hypothetical protein
MIGRALLTAAVAALAGPAGAQVIAPCLDDWRANVAALAEPWGDMTATAAGGEVRLAIVDTIEPAAAAFHLILLSPPYDETGGRQCLIVSAGDGAGFAGLSLEGADSAGDLASGLTLSLPASQLDEGTGEMLPARLTVTLDAGTGAVGAALGPAP